MDVRAESLRLTVDVAALQRLPEVSPLLSDVRLGPIGGMCTAGGPSATRTCCCTFSSFHDQD